MEIAKDSDLAAYDIDQISKRGQLREALDLALTAIRGGAYDDDLFFIAANIAFQLGDLEKAEQLIARLLALDPEHVNGWMLFGDIYSRKNDITRADYGYQRAQSLFPALTEMKRESEGKVDKEIKTERTPLKTERKQNAASPIEISFDTLTFAEICARQGYYNKALKIYHDLLAKDPESEELKKKIEELEKRLTGND